MCLDRAKARLLQILARFFFIPHGTQPLAAFEGDNHAVHAGDRVQQCSERVLDVLSSFSADSPATSGELLGSIIYDLYPCPALFF